MNTNYLFATPVFAGDLDVDLQSPIDFCLKLASKEPSRIASNRGGYQSRDLWLPDYPEMGDLVIEMKNKIYAISKKIDIGCELALDKAWFNINHRGDYNEYHYHALSALSGVVYLKCDDKSGNIRFLNESLIDHYPFRTESPMFWTTVDMAPTPGTMIIFPSWLKHCVLPSESDDVRISIAFNIRQIK